MAKKKKITKDIELRMMSRNEFGQRPAQVFKDKSRYSRKDKHKTKLY